MSSAGGASKSLRLRFKGDKSEKKKKTKRKHPSSSSKARGEDAESDVADVDGEEQAWVTVERLTDLAGPAFIAQSVTGSTRNDTPELVCLALEPTRGRVIAQRVTGSTSFSVADEDDARQAALLDLDGAEVVSGPGVEQIQTRPTIQTAEPSTVTQVWVCTRVLDTPGDRPRYTLRSSESRFLTGERNDSLSALSEARGPLEEWTLVMGQGSDAFSFINAHGKLLGILSNTDNEKLTLACVDNDRRRESSVDWHIRVQWKHRHEARKRERGVAPLRERDPMMKRLRTAEQT